MSIADHIFASNAEKSSERLKLEALFKEMNAEGFIAIWVTKDPETGLKKIHQKGSMDLITTVGVLEVQLLAMKNTSITTHVTTSVFNK